MTIRKIRLLCIVLVAAWTSMSSAAASAPEADTPSACRAPAYPVSARRAGEEGVSLLGFLVHADGKVDHAMVFNSSGSAALDQAARDAFSICIFRPATQDGTPIDTWVEVAYVWSQEGDLEMNRPKREAALAARKGDLGALFQLYLLLSRTAETDAERAAAATLLQNAATRGYAHAQFELGRRYEQGSDGIPADSAHAMQLYQQAAAQGDLLAMQRVTKGILP